MKSRSLADENADATATPAAAALCLPKDAEGETVTAAPARRSVQQSLRWWTTTRSTVASKPRSSCHHSSGALFELVCVHVLEAHAVRASPSIARPGEPLQLSEDCDATALAPTRFESGVCKLGSQSCSPVQSEVSTHSSPTSQRSAHVEPPQSTPVSSSSRTPLKHELHVPVCRLQAPDRQSPSVPQAPPAPQGSQTLPPQSTSDSSPSCSGFGFCRRRRR
eukprot:SAG11_NODE_1469_length_4850_cov_2.659651_3_plen_221_part_00